jgi:hypothetical protein
MRTQPGVIDHSIAAKSTLEQNRGYFYSLSNFYDKVVGSMAKRNKAASSGRVSKLSSAMGKKSERAIRLFKHQIKKSRTFYGADKLNIFDDPKAFSEVSRLISADKTQQQFLNRYFRHQASSLIRSIFEERHRATKTEVKTALKELELGMINSQRFLEVSSVMERLQNAGERLNSAMAIPMLLIEVEKRATLALTILDEENVATTTYWFEPEELCAAVIAEAWRWRNTKYPSNTDEVVGLAASTFWFIVHEKAGLRRGRVKDSMWGPYFARRQKFALKGNIADMRRVLGVAPRVE